MQMRLQSTVLFVSDIGQSKNFYRDFLDQEVMQDGIFNVTFASGLALYQKGRECGLSCDFEAPDDQLPQDIRKRMDAGRAVEPGEPGEPEMEIYFETDDILGCTHAVYEAGIPIFHPLVEKPWGQRVFRFYDPDRHLIEVGEAMDTVVRRYANANIPPEDIAEKTFMSVAAINRILETPI